MDVDFDFSDVDQFFEDGEAEVLDVMDQVGKESVQYAKDKGSFQNRTGVLRAANAYEVTQEALTLKNETEYASFVESKGFDVLGNAALHAEKRLKEEIE